MREVKEALNRLQIRARLAGHGGQILISSATYELVRREFPESWFVDIGSHRLKNLHQPERIFQIIHPELQRDFPPLKTLDVLPNNLPAQLTSFIGREAEIRKIAELLGKEQVRLVTLTGAGGIILGSPKTMTKSFKVPNRVPRSL